MSERWVVLALAPARSEWCRRLAGWADSGTLPVELVRCQSAAELRSKLNTTRPFSAVIVDADVHGVDNELLGRGSTECPVIVVDAHVSRQLSEAGAVAVLDPKFDPAALIDALARTSEPVPSGAAVPGDPASLDDSPLVLGRLIAVCGTGSAGASTTAIALGQGIASGAAGRWIEGPAVVADLCRRADLAMLHDARDILVGADELIDAHRARLPSSNHVRSHCLPVVERGYDLLLGLRQPRGWTALRPRAVDAAIKSLRVAYASVVADVEPDVEGEAETGSMDVEERNAMSRCAVLAADAVLVVGLPGLHGTHGLVRLVRDLVGVGVDAQRILPVVNRAPRSAGARAEITTALADLCTTDAGLPGPPLFLPERRIDEALCSGLALPRSLCAVVTRAAAAVVERAPLNLDESSGLAGPRVVTPGSLGLAGRAETW